MPELRQGVPAELVEAREYLGYEGRRLEPYAGTVALPPNVFGCSSSAGNGDRI